MKHEPPAAPKQTRARLMILATVILFVLAQLIPEAYDWMMLIPAAASLLYIIHSIYRDHPDREADRQGRGLLWAIAGGLAACAILNRSAGMTDIAVNSFALAGLVSVYLEDAIG